MLRTFISLFIALLIMGLFWPILQKLNMGHLPGDFIIKTGSLSFYLPLVSAAILSLVLSGILWFIRK
ncbi:hypothetical protein BH10PSE19_BH10PSE19_15340 [soil metagenome]